MPRRRLFKKPDTWEYGHDAPADERPLAKPGKGRAATMVVYASMFFAGAAFTAVAGDRFAQMTSSDESAATESATTTADATDATAEAAPAADAAATEAAAPETSAPAPATEAASAPADATAEAAAPSATPEPDDLTPNRSTSSSDTASSDAPATSAGGSSAFINRPTSASPKRKARHARHAETSAFILLPKLKPAPKPEIEGPEHGATVWLNSPLPDPTPPAARLSPAFARNLRLAASENGIHWSLLLGALRAKGATGRTPADGGTLFKLADRLGDLQKNAGGQWATALAYGRTASFADKALALARYDRAVGLDALVNGLEASKNKIAQRLLSDPAISIYGGGRDDIAKGKVDVRVLALISYLHESFGQVTVSCLISGHRLYARPGVISAHIFGRAADISSLGGTSIFGHSAPGGITEQAVRDILLLPNEVMPRQVISLLGLGGPSFPLANHADHIHVGY